MASSVSHVIGKWQPSNLTGRRSSGTDAMGEQYPTPTCGPCSLHAWPTSGPHGTRCTSPAISRFFRPSLYSTSPHTSRPHHCLHSALITFLSPLVTRAHEMPPPQVGAAISFTFPWSSRPPVPPLYRWGWCYCTRPSSSSTLSLAKGRGWPLQ
jgi:hypothetical protein